MYKWKIDVVLKNSGVLKSCTYVGPEDTEVDVIKKLFHGRESTYYVDLYGKDETVATYICVGDVAAIDIYGRRKV